jgi:hypothetical protein
VDVDPSLSSPPSLREAVFNLVDNAIDAATSWVRIAAALDDDDQLVLTVEDDGPGFRTEPRTGRSSRSSPPSPTAPAWAWPSPTPWSASWGATSASPPEPAGPRSS